MPIHSFEQGKSALTKVGLLQFDEPLTNIFSLFAAILTAIGIVVAGRIGRRTAELTRLPTVLGELLIGIALANIGGFLGIPLAKKMFHWHETTESLQRLSFSLTPMDATLLTLWLLSSVGILLLMFQVGLETNLSDLKKNSAPATKVAVLGMIVPFALGYFLSFVLIPDSTTMAALFLGGTLSATSIAVTARVLKDAKILETPISQIVLGAAVIDDILGMILLAGISGWASGGSQIGWVIIGTVISIIAAVAIYRLVKKWDAIPTLASSFLAALLTTLGAVSGLSAIVGAFVAGAILSEQKHLHNKFTRWEGALAPVFFVVTGMQVDLRLFFDVPTILFSIILTTVAVIGKLFSGLGVKDERTFVGVAMIPRGEMGLVFVSFGQTLGVFPAKIFASIVFMVLVTSVVSPLWLRFLMKKSYRAH